MVTYKTGIEFGTNVGVLSRDMQTAAQATRVFGTEAATSLRTGAVAADNYTLAAQRVVAAQTRLAASQERLTALQAAGNASTREMAAAQASFVRSQEVLLAAQTRQVEMTRASAAAQHSTGGLGLVAGLAGTAAALKIKDAIEDGARNAANLQAINRQLDATLQSTGDTAHTSVAGIDALTASISKQTGITQQATRGGALLELTFTGIRNQGTGAGAVFDRAAKAAADMAVGLHLARGGAVDYQGAMQLLGRALNDPVAGMTSLQRAGVSFTAQQKEQIKTLAQNGDLLGAQERVIDLVTQKYASAAKTYASTAEGAGAQARETLDQLQQTLASPILSGGVPILHALTDTMQFFIAHPGAVELGEVAVGLTGAAFAAASFERAIRFLRESQWLVAISRWLFGYRSLETTVARLDTAEAAEGASAVRAAEAQTALAAGYERTAAAATAAAEAQMAAATATDAAAASTVPAAAAGGAGLLARLMTGGAGRLATGATIAAGLIDPVVLASIFAGGGGDPKGLDQATAQQNNLAGQFRKVRGSFYAGNYQILDRKTIADLTLLGGQVKGGSYLTDPQLKAFARANPDLYNYAAGGQTKTTVTQNKLLMAALAEGASTAVQGFGGLPNVSTTQLSAEQSLIGGVLPGLSDAPSTRVADHAAALAAADRSVQAARRRYQAAQRAVGAVQAGAADPNKEAAAQLRLTAAEDRLLQVRLKHSTTGAQVASAEAAIASARARVNTLNDVGVASTGRLAAAEDRLKTAHDALMTAQDRQAKAQRSAGGALSGAQVVARFTANAKQAQDLVAAQRSLARQGLEQGVIEQLDALEKQAPGTLGRVAKSLTPAMVKQLNAQYGAMQKAQQDFLTIPFQAAALAAQAQHEAAIRTLAHADAAAVIRYFGQTAGQPAHPLAVPGAPRAGAFDGAPLGVHMGSTGPVAAPQVHVHVHTSAPRSVRNETTIQHATFDSQSWETFQRDQKRRRAVWN